MAKRRRAAASREGRWRGGVIGERGREREMEKLVKVAFKEVRVAEAC